MSKSVFISHAVKDKALAREIVDLIEDGIGVPENEIFCSSLDGYGIPSGKNFVTFIQTQMLEPKIVVLILTPAYFESKFCVSELGAAWIKSHALFPILVPPLQHSDIKDVLLGTQVANIDDDIKYNELREALISTIKFTPKSQTKWDTKRRSFLKTIGPLLKKVSGRTLVSADEFNAQTAQLEEARAELDASEAEIRNLKTRLAETEALKDKTQVVALRAKHQDNAIVDRFGDLIDEIKEFQYTLKGGEVMKLVLSDHYDKPYEIDWDFYRDEFALAARFGFIDVNDHDRPMWSQRDMTKLNKKLDELDAFIAENAEALSDNQGEDAPRDPGAQDFWEYYYKI